VHFVARAGYGVARFPAQGDRLTRHSRAIRDRIGIPKPRRLPTTARLYAGTRGKRKSELQKRAALRSLLRDYVWSGAVFG
jgi:hypothetical protein